jgi:ElaB/YqjD/DUF883 family membrane-anchored ribosome-binding protein
MPRFTASGENFYPSPMKSPAAKKPSDLARETKELVANITNLMEEAEEMLNESTSHHAEEKIALLRARTRGEKRAIARYIAAKEKVARLAKQTDATIRACPYESLAIALGIGAVLGGIFSRQRR